MRTFSASDSEIVPSVAPALVRPATQSGSLIGSPSGLAFAPYSGLPVHWFDSTRIITWLAVTSGMSNVFSVRLGAVGRGRCDGNASGLLTKTRLKFDALSQPAEQVRISNCRSAEK